MRRQRRHEGGEHGPQTQLIVNNLCLLNLVIRGHILIGVGEQITRVYDFHRRLCAKLAKPDVGLQLVQCRVAQNEIAPVLWMSK